MFATRNNDLSSFTKEDGEVVIPGGKPNPHD
jgi:hypothetical protein